MGLLATAGLLTGALVAELAVNGGSAAAEEGLVAAEGGWLVRDSTEVSVSFSNLVQ